MVETLRHQDFAPYVGKRFTFPGQPVMLRLASVSLQEHAGAPDAPRTPFTLVFHGPVGEVLPEGLYQAEIENGPVLEFYIMPIHTAVRDRQDYQAVFN
jgi:hypothetical protein